MRKVIFSVTLLEHLFSFHVFNKQKNSSGGFRTNRVLQVPWEENNI